MKKIILLSAVSLVSFWGCDTKKTEIKEEPVDILFLKEGELQLKNKEALVKQMDIEFAIDPIERENGLMNRSKMAENQGMLFVFDKENNTRFWMKDTRIPLDILYIGKDSTVINVQKNAQPFDVTTDYGPKAPYWYVLEINGGKADEWGVVEGQTKLSWKSTDK